ncbi:hypothetical protein PG993_012626 [Apiospora rasikravindrae]|uniref:Coagulation factor 5/8 type domain-containing protein n=1 Tax=Apiospora rasikravindrae TaxID=990691 RepID=A0ABR1S4E0_9PEZI
MRAALACILLLGTAVATAAAPKTMFLFKDVLQSNTTALTTSGFNTLLIFRIGLTDAGDLVYYSTGSAGEAVDAPVVRAGVYTGGSALSDKIRAFKTSPGTRVDRVEVSLVSHDTTFQIIRDLVASEGTGPESTLYRNFEALRAAWAFDALNNDDEGVYDMTSTIAFAQMLGGLGLKYTIAPYTNRAFWADAVSRINADDGQLLDHVYLQVYDGGAGNDPAAWQSALGGMKIAPVEWVVNDAKPYEGTSPEAARAEFAQWFAEGGRGYWNDYDVEKMGSSYAEYGNVLTDVFG